MADYGVNINLRVKGQSGLDRLNAKVKELTKSVDSIRFVDIMNPRNTGGAGGKGGRKTIKQYRQDMEALVKTVNKSRGAFGKTANQQMAAADALQEYANNLKLGTKAQKAAATAAAKQIKNIDLETTAILENTKARKNNRDLASRMGGGGKNPFPMENPKGNKAALTSGLISGAFPLLFGQGIAGGAAGFAGGFIGTKAGGKMGGFAGGLVATAVLQQITTFFEGINTLAGAFSELNPNIEQATVALGLNGTAEAERIKLIEKSQGKMVALALVTEKMNEAIGERGVKNLKEFSEATRSLGNSFKLAMTKMQAALAPLFTLAAKAVGNVTGSSAREADRLAKIGGAETDPVLKALEAELAGVGTGSGQGRQAVKRASDKKADIQARIDARKKELANNGENLEKEQLRAAQYDEITRSVEKQNQFLNESITLGGREAEIQEKLREFDRKALEFDKEINKKERDQFENLLRLQEELKRVDNLYSGIADTVQSGVVDAIDGAITGTMTLGEVASSVFGSIRRQLIDFGATSFLRAIPGIGGFFANGGVTKPNKSYIVGERGPELFTPGITGRVTPNHELGGSSTNVVVNVDASGSSVEGDEEQGRQLGLAISAAVQSEIIQQKRPGGLLA